MNDAQPDDSLIVASRRRHRLVAGAALLAGTPGFLFCGLAHICMAGHMQHPPYPLWQSISDVFWCLAFAVAALAGFGSDMSPRALFSFLALSLVALRFVAGSAGGASFLVELPAWIALVVMFLRGVRRRPTAPGG